MEIKRTGKTALVVTLQLGSTPGGGLTQQGTVSGDGTTGGLPFTKTQPVPTALVKSYTFLVPSTATGNALLPEGDGYQHHLRRRFAAKTVAGDWKVCRWSTDGADDDAGAVSLATDMPKKVRLSPRQCPTPCEKVEASMNPHLTEIAYILDRSGSMQPMQEPAVTAFNDFVKSQLDVPGDARLTLIQFDDAYEVPVSAKPIQDVPQLTAATYTPRGSTALLDAIGRTIKETDRRISALPDMEKPGKVIFAIFTDGEENASHEYTAKHISDLIRLYRDQKGWEFLFLAANQDAIASASAMHMDAHLSGNVSFSLKGVISTGSAMARKVRAMRMKSGGNMDAQAMEDDAKSMNDIVKEEEQKP